MRRIRSKFSLKKKYIKDMASQSEKLFFDLVESIYNVTIDRQFYLSYRFFDGRYGNHLIEVDGEKWHSSNKAKSRDKYKDKLAKNHGFQIHRIKLNSIKEVPIAIESNRTLLEEIFNGRKESSIPTEKRSI